MKTITITPSEENMILDALQIAATSDSYTENGNDAKAHALIFRIQRTPTAYSPPGGPRKWASRTGFRTWSKMGNSQPKPE